VSQPKVVFALCFATALLLGCAQGPEYAGLAFDVESAPPVLVNIQSDHITLVAGVAVQISVAPLSSEEDFDDDVRVALRGANPSLLEVFAGKGDREFVLVAVAAGDTCLNVALNRKDQECIPVHISDGAN
jgi:hypothetical protein